MRFSIWQWLRVWWPSLDRRVWILASGRLLSEVGIGFTLVYAPIFFVDQVGLSTTQVGVGIGLGSLVGLLGRFLGGSMADAPQWGRRITLLLSAAVSALADGVLVLAQNFHLFVLGNLLMGLGVGLYWPATEAVVADITTPEERNEAFAIVRLADNLGLGLGIVLGGLLITLTGAYRTLFMIDGLTFLLFFAIVYRAIPETQPVQATKRGFWQGWQVALTDVNLLIYVVVNTLFTSYMAQVQSTLPVYLHQFVRLGESGQGFSELALSQLFTWHIALAALIQIQLARALRAYPLLIGLMLSACLWGGSFGLVWLTGMGADLTVVWAVLALSVMAVAQASYTPLASAFVVQLAPDSLRGVYLSMNSMCWAMGYFIGPPLGGWALDQSRVIADGFWLGAALSTGVAIAILYGLYRRVAQG